MPQPSATTALGLPFIELQSVDSTNNYARRQIHAGLAQAGMAIFAHEQLAGRGQRGKVWASEKGANITLSLVINPAPLPLTEQFQLSACVAVAIHDFFSRYAGDETKIKWPNDLYWQDRKAGGILIESVVHGRKPGMGNPDWTSIVGVGININQTSFHPEIKNPVSLKQITGKQFDPVELSKELCLVLDKRFTELKVQGFEPAYASYLDHLYKKNETVELKKGSKTFEVMIQGVSPTGKLMTNQLVPGDPLTTGFDFGEVQWLIK